MLVNYFFCALGLFLYDRYIAENIKSVLYGYIFLFFSFVC